MTVSDLRILMDSLSLCEYSIDYMAILKNFLENIGISDVERLGVNGILYKTIVTLRDQFDLKDVSYYEYCECGGIIENNINLLNIIYDDSLQEITSKNIPFKLFIQEPPFRLSDDMVMDSFLGCISHIEFEDGFTVKIDDLSSEKGDGDELSEIETFFNFIDIDLYRNIINKSKRELVFINNYKCDECDKDDSDLFMEYINLIFLMFKEFMELKEDEYI